MKLHKFFPCVSSHQQQRLSFVPPTISTVDFPLIRDLVGGLSMGEIDAKPIESVQTALSFLGHRNDQKKSSPAYDDQEVEKDRELESLEKELANVKLQLEAKDSAYKQALAKIDHHQKTAGELTTLLKKSDFQKDFYISEFQEANVRINELELTVERMAHQLSESEKVQEQLSHVTSDLVPTKGQLLNMERELAVLREAKDESSSQAEAMGRALSGEKQKTEELLRQVSEMNGTIMHLKMKAAEVEREKADALSGKEAELELAAKAVSEAQEQLECARKQVEGTHDLENQLLEKSAYLDSLEVELNRANELQISTEKVASDATFELNQLKEDMELQEKKNLDLAAYISLLETELKQLRTELGDADAEACRLNEYIENMKMELEKAKEKENDAQVEIALLKFEVHKGRSKLAAAEAAEARAQSEKMALYNALQQMGLEAEETKKENRVLKEAMKLADESKSSRLLEPHGEVHSEAKETQKNNEANTEYKKEAISRNKYENLSKQVEEGNKIHDPLNENGKELENTKKELELTMSKLAELRTRAEQAISRAEAAEKAKAALEEQIKKRKEHKERRKAAIAVLREESISRDFSTTNSTKYDTSTKNYQPLGKVLNMKF